VVLKCLSLVVGILLLEKAQKSMLLNLILPSLDILIDGPQLLNNLHVYLQYVLLDYL
jgi:hypothetical protein